MFSLQLGESTAELLILCPQPPHLANQLANHANQVRLRQTVQRIRGASGHPQLESHFRGLDSPLARKFAPVATPPFYVLENWSFSCLSSDIAAACLPQVTR